jgi:hypothetical protein
MRGFSNDQIAVQEEITQPACNKWGIGGRNVGERGRGSIKHYTS